MEIEVKGHSGCDIDIVREGKNLFIYKSTHDKKYLNRLVSQAEKQKAAAELEYQHIRVPEIFDITSSEEQVRVKMEYIYSKNFIGYFESAGFEQISYFIKALILFIEKELKTSPVMPVSPQILTDKFENIEIRIAENSMLANDPQIADMLQESKKIFMSLKSVVIPIGTCHGDLTFSNILFNGNNYYLIDFLDSFIESPLIDIVKIRQDSAYKWSQLMYIHDYDKLRLDIISEKIDKEISDHFSKYDWYNSYYGVSQLMNFWRIMQYANEERVVSYLKTVINKILYEF